MRRHWIALAVPFVLVLCFFVFLFSGIRRTVVDEIRKFAMFTAVCVASDVDPADVESIKGVGDVSGAAYGKLQKLLLKFKLSARDIRFIYIMRRSTAAGAKPSDYEYVVDFPAMDQNGNGKIDEDEKCMPPGEKYDGAALPAMINAWNEPDADMTAKPDAPPFPDCLSGYAPIRNAAGRTVAIVGADITAGEIEKKLTAVRFTVILYGVIIAGLLSAIIFLYCGRAEALAKIREVNAELEMKNRRLEEAAMLRSDLSNMIVHDMRNLLTVASGYNGLMASCIQELPATAGPVLGNMQKMTETAIGQMSEFLHDMLVLAKSESGRLVPNLADVDVNGLLLDAARQAEVLAKTAEVAIECILPEGHVVITADRQLLSRVVDNLLSNALKHSPQYGRIQLKLLDSKVPGGAGLVKIIVADEGRGVEPDLRVHLFEKFRSGDQSLVATRAIGLGLAFCKMAVEVHNGRIYLEESGKGSVFVVELPCP